MAITVCGNCIEFGGSYTMCSTPTGFSVNGAIKAGGYGTAAATISPMQGTTCGFHTGGCGGPPAFQNGAIESYPFSADTGSTCVGTLHDPCTSFAAGMSSQENGYHAHAFGPTRDVSKFPFASVGTATDASELTIKFNNAADHSSPTDGYASGAGDPLAVGRRIDKFPFAADNPATFVGGMEVGTTAAAGTSSLTHGYTHMGFDPSNIVNCLQFFPFAIDEQSIVVAADGTCRCGAAGISSCTRGFTVGGTINPGSDVCNIETFLFSSYTPVSNVANLSRDANQVTGSNSCTDGYVHNTRQNICGLEKFPFASFTPVSIIGCLTSRFCNGAGQQD